MGSTNDNRPPAIIVKKIIAGDAGHHGGAWKVAYADFVTAMMAFFLIMWIIGATNEDQRKGIADYFRPTLAQQSQGGGANGFMAGRSLHAEDGIAVSNRGATSELSSQIGQLDRSIEPEDFPDLSKNDLTSFEEFRKKLLELVRSDPNIKQFENQLTIRLTPEGLQLEVTDAPGKSMFEVGQTRSAGMAKPVIKAVAKALDGLDNVVSIRGHTDGRRYAKTNPMNNWLLSAGRADVVRRMLEDQGVEHKRFERIEGSADRELRNPEDPMSATNRRITITLLFSEPGEATPDGFYGAE